MKTVTDFTPQAILDNWLMVQIKGGNAWREIDSDAPLRSTPPLDWPPPHTAFRLRSRDEETLVVMRRSIETVLGARVTLSVSACVQTGASDNPPRTHDSGVNNRLVVAIDPAGNDDLFVAGVLADDVPIEYQWRDYTLGADATGRRATLYVGAWFAKAGQWPVTAMNMWLRSLRLEVETLPDGAPPPEPPEPPGPGPVIVSTPGIVIEAWEDAGEFIRAVVRLPKADPR